VIHLILSQGIICLAVVLVRWQESILACFSEIFSSSQVLMWEPASSILSSLRVRSLLLFMADAKFLIEME
jgi:hypothetical protein